MSGDAPIEDLFFSAAKRGHDLNEFLPQVKDVNMKDAIGSTALHYAAQGGHVDAVTALLKAKANINAVNNSGDTPLHKAAWAGRPEVCFLLNRSGADLNIKNKQGETALKLAKNAESANALQPIAKGRLWEDDAKTEEPGSDDD